jgi:DNA end-binding protein Ku
MAASLIESLGADFDPASFHDEYRDAVVAMIEQKRATGDARPAPVAEKPDAGGDSMSDLLTALQRSVEAARGGRPDAPAAAAKEPAEKPAKKSSRRRKADADEPEAPRKRTRKPA